LSPLQIITKTGYGYRFRSGTTISHVTSSCMPEMRTGQVWSHGIKKREDDPGVHQEDGPQR
ncbi:hypothetical protein, partial [Listeria monocytogenes]|uniref:hypothetical protein n=1 Tax=Listeria monocytogenes TaxID=1639 RepID=UPI00313312B4